MQNRSVKNPHDSVACRGSF
uniref:Uncharacterized protein n=1 Tax=Anguilla anguilla TaxID=7936 RepID=A0A0E9QE07_ANGAN